MELTEVGDGVIAVRGRDVNWTILRDGKRFTLVDAGYPRYVDAVRQSVRRAGLTMAGLEAIVVTHAHVDHIGGVPALLRSRPVPVYVGEAEVPMAVGAWVESAGPIDVAMNLWKPRYVPWSVRITLAGGAAHVKVPEAIGVADGSTLDVPGRPKVIWTPGHTSGHICLLVGKALLAGDALMTGHAVSGRSGPQMLPDFFHTDPDQALVALDRLAATKASVVVPGHGRVWNGAVKDAVDAIRA
ncbi:MAG TPA: MBL fold metallo-hydrolase [Aeromicrobium sp.]|nr:MBL fold metallo-hydrolase [Aeromicrobium sp.]